MATDAGRVSLHGAVTRPVAARVLVTAWLFAAAGVQALTINLTPDPGGSLTTYLSTADVTNAENAFAYAAQQFQNAFSDPININIIMAADPNAAIIGTSHTVQLLGSYNGVRLGLTNDNNNHPSADGTTSLSCLPLTDPTGSGTGFGLARAQEKAIGTISNGSTDLTNDRRRKTLPERNSSGLESASLPGVLLGLTDTHRRTP